MGASWVLPSTLTTYEQSNIVGSNQEAHIVFFKANFTENSHHFAYFSRKHTGSTHVSFLGDMINGP